MTTSWQQRTSRHPRAVDLTVAVLLFPVTVIGSRITTPDTHPRDGLLVPVILAGIASAVLPAHRTHPRTVLAVTTVCTMVAGVRGYLPTGALLAPVIAALYWFAVQSSRTATRIAAIATMIPLVATPLIVNPGEHVLLQTLSPITLVLLPVAFGTATRMRRAYLEALHARLEDAERTREDEARHRVAEERMRIARELHDVVAHHLALANAQAGTAAHLAGTHPEQTRQILADLAGTTSSALRELKATVGLLRQANDPDSSLEPSPGLDRLADLTTSLASAGLTVTVTTEGEHRELSPAVDLTAFRIIQEALTNVTKHAAARTAEVRLRYVADRLTITVTDQGAGRARTASGPGFGLIGMRERAHSVGGRLQAGPRPEGGFQVTAELPLTPQTPEEDPTP